MEDLQTRDQKGLYSGALKGEIQNVVGVDIPFVKPNANLVINNAQSDFLEQKVQKILNSIKKNDEES